VLVGVVGGLHLGVVLEELRPADVCVHRVEVIKDVTASAVLKTNIFRTKSLEVGSVNRADNLLFECLVRGILLVKQVGGGVMGTVEFGDGGAFGGTGDGGAGARVSRDDKGSSREGVVDFDRDGELLGVG
jgi:hypothetical protein